MASPNRTLAAHKPNGNHALRHQYAAAVLNGIYASFGATILEAGKEDFDKAIRAARRVALAQADEMVRAAS